MYALVDCNNFYASCERVFNPRLRGRPVVVLSNNDGCVIARSAEAKKLIPMGAPAFEYEPVFRQHQMAVFSSNFCLYADMSQRVMNVLASFTPAMEIYSIDEAFLSLKGFGSKNLHTYGQEMIQRVGQFTHIPISVGIAPSKALAKIANRVAKKQPEKTQGLCVLQSEAERQAALEHTPVGDIWGIGRKTAAKLQRLGIHRAAQFCQLSDAFIKRQFTVVGLRLKWELQGRSVLALEEVQAKQSISSTRSFAQSLTTLTQLEERVSNFVSTAAAKLRAQDSAAQAILVFLRTNPFRPQEPQYQNHRVLPLPYPTNSTISLSKAAKQALQPLFKEGYEYKKAGIVLLNLIPAKEIQQNLFAQENPKHATLMQAMDKLNAQLGAHTIRLGSQSAPSRKLMRQEHLSPKYTTDWNQLLEVQ